MWFFGILFFGLVSSCLSDVVTRYNLCNNRSLDVFERGVNETSADLIVKRHNFYRESIMKGAVPGQPKGRNIKYLKWDKELARAAQEIADTCYFRHQTAVDDRWRYKLGQNLFRREQPFYKKKAGNWTRAVERWYLEYKIYRYGPLDINFEETGHYTQLIWDRTYLIGCGFIAYENERHNDNDVAELYVCHYGPSGNRFFQYPYQLSRGPELDEADNAKDKKYYNEYYDEYFGEFFKD